MRLSKKKWVLRSIRHVDPARGHAVPLSRQRTLSAAVAVAGIAADGHLAAEKHAHSQVLAGVRDSGHQRALALQATPQNVQGRSGLEAAARDFALAEAGGGAAGPGELFDRADGAFAEGILADRTVAFEAAEREAIGFGGEGERKEAIEARTRHAESK